jgi:hypothetical protein
MPFLSGVHCSYRCHHELCRNGEGAGVSIYSGKRNASLIPGNSIIADSRLHRFSQWKRMYQPGIGFDCVGCKFVRNTMYDAPHSGILGHGNDCTVPAFAPWILLSTLDFCQSQDTATTARCAFSDRNLHLRMPLDPTHVRLKRTGV